jgi:ATP-binding cassette subfamily B protein/ATP-binding cassette subfamily C protein
VKQKFSKTKFHPPQGGRARQNHPAIGWFYYVCSICYYDKMKKLSTGQQAKAVAGVAKLSFKIAPVAVVFKLTGAIIDAVLPIITTYYAALTTTALVSAYSGSHADGDRAITYVLITASLGLLMTIWRSIDNYMQSKMRYLVEARVSDHMYTHFLTLDFWRYDDKETADLYDRALKFSNFFAWVFDRIASVISQLIGMITAIIALALFQPLLALFVFTALAPGVYLQFRLSRKQIAHWNENIEVRRAQNMLEWHFSRPKEISELRLYGMVDFLLGHRRRLRDIDEKGRLEFERQFMPSRLAADALEAIVEVGTLIWIVLQIIAKNQPVGQFVYVQQIVSRAMASASAFASTLGNIDEDIANLFDYEQFMQLPAGVTGDIVLKTPPQKIEFQHVSFVYPGSKQTVLNNISFTINVHDHIAIVGENGAGKSTLVKILTGLYRPTEGKVLVDGIDLADIDVASWHRQLGVLQQDFIHYNFAKARDNVRYGAIEEPDDDSRIEQALKDAEAEKVIAKLPRGLDNYLNNWMEDDKGNKGVELSGGQWQRLALARDFYRNAPIVILDEPTSAIDALAESRIFDRLFADSKRTLVTISHRMSTIERASTIYMLEDGKLVESGTHKQLVAKKGRYYRMFKSQIKG